MSVHAAIVLGASAGGLRPIRELLLALPPDYPLAVIVVQHMAERSNDGWVRHLDHLAGVRIKEAEEKEAILPGTVYLAPGNYHLLVETDRTFSLSMDERVNYARPSIDVLFGSAADAYGKALIGVVLSGGNTDGAEGLRAVKAKGGLTIVQDPATADAPSMPTAAMALSGPDHVLSPAGIRTLLMNIPKEGNPPT
jgi:two-component system chemotaxis response regulator CheB